MLINESSRKVWIVTIVTTIITKESVLKKFTCPVTDVLTINDINILKLPIYGFNTFNHIQISLNIWAKLIERSHLEFEGYIKRRKKELLWLFIAQNDVFWPWHANESWYLALFDTQNGGNSSRCWNSISVYQQHTHPKMVSKLAVRI